jgi:hypothetical protein
LSDGTMLEAVQELLSKDANDIFGMKTVPNAAISIPNVRYGNLRTVSLLNIVLCNVNA